MSVTYDDPFELLGEKHIMGIVFLVFSAFPYRDLKDSLTLFREFQLYLLSVYHTPQTVLPVYSSVSHIYPQKISCETEPNRRAWVDKHRRSPFIPFDPPGILQISMIRRNSHRSFPPRKSLLHFLFFPHPEYIS